ncbi:MAG: MoaD/ThiS family protein [Bacillota bacterium]|nr:MoaD/ThiS family protein [Bacillota bacterium]
MDDRIPPAVMQVTVYLHGAFRARAGFRSTVCDVPAGTDVRGLLLRLDEQASEPISELLTGAGHDAARVMVNGRWLTGSDLGMPLADGDRVDLLMALAGG